MYLLIFIILIVLIICIAYFYNKKKNGNGFGLSIIIYTCLQPEKDNIPEITEMVKDIPITYTYFNDFKQYKDKMQIMLHWFSIKDNKTDPEIYKHLDAYNKIVNYDKYNSPIICLFNNEKLIGIMQVSYVITEECREVIFGNPVINGSQQLYYFMFYVALKNYEYIELAIDRVYINLSGKNNIADRYPNIQLDMIRGIAKDFGYLYAYKERMFNTPCVCVIYKQVPENSYERYPEMLESDYIDMVGDIEEMMHKWFPYAE